MEYDLLPRLGFGQYDFRTVPAPTLYLPEPFDFGKCDDVIIRWSDVAFEQITSLRFLLFAIAC